ncbi:MAG: hypothetical protein HY042_09525, partial [Spirochaetia bacterium]|nr:hypothetical protein [Spirochaetia bacterium]
MKPIPLVLRAALGPALAAAGFLTFTFQFLRVIELFNTGALPDQYLFSADAVYPATLYNDLFVDRYSAKAWMFPPATCFFPDVFFYFIARFLTGNFVSATFLFAFLQISAFAGALAVLHAQVLGPGTRALSLALAFTVAAGALALSSAGGLSDWLLCMFTPTHHLGAAVAALWCLWLLLQLFSASSIAKERLLLAALFALSCISAGSDKLFLFLFTLPSPVLLIIAAPLTRVRRFLYGMVITLSAAAGLWFMAKLESHGAFFAGSVPTKHILLSVGTWHGISVTLASAGHVVSSLPWPLLSAVLACFVVITLHVIRWFGGSDEQQTPLQISVYLLVAWPAVLMAGSLVAGTAHGTDIGGYKRYFLTLILLPPALTLPLVLRLAPVAVRTSVAALLLGCIAAVTALQWRAFPELGRDAAQDSLADCLDKNAEELHFETGFSDYWNAKRTTLFSRRGLRVY